MSKFNYPCQMHKVKSSNLAKIGLYEPQQRMFVEFNNGNVYSYSPITQEVFQALKTADSVGRFFSDNIRNSETIFSAKH